MNKPKCQVNYIGSKYRLLDFIHSAIVEYVPDLESKVFCDLFAGTGVVARHFKPLVKHVIANDLEFYSYVFIRNYIENNKVYDRLNELNELNGIQGFIFNNYCVGGGKKVVKIKGENVEIERQYFSDDNGKKIDAIRLQIEKWKNETIIGDSEYYFYLCSLLEAADKVANTTSVYGAYLKELKKSAQKPLFLETPYIDSKQGLAYNQDANRLITKISGDILYLDPPYNEREYGANYHMLNTIAKYDNFEPSGVTGLRDYNRSLYCSKESVLQSFQRLIANAKFKYIFLSYNNEGLLSLRDIHNCMCLYGEYRMKRIRYNRFKADGKRSQARKCTFELLHCLKKR